MPSPWAALGIVVFWLSITGYLIHRDVWPRYFGDAPPVVAIELIDEATQQAPTRWTIYRGDQKIGSLSTYISYDAANDSFWFTSSYSALRIDAGALRELKVELDIPKLHTGINVGRAGELRGQSLDGEVRLLVGNLELGSAAAKIAGQVDLQNRLMSRCELRYPISLKEPNYTADLEPVPVRGGQVLNAMMPVNRLRGVVPGKRWVVREVDPLGEAIALFATEMLGKAEFSKGLGLGKPKARELIAEVQTEQEVILNRSNQSISCYVILYRSEELTARTLVSVNDGRIMRQEAAIAGERLRFEREE